MVDQEPLLPTPEPEPTAPELSPEPNGPVTTGPVKKRHFSILLLLGLLLLIIVAACLAWALVKKNKSPQSQTASSTTKTQLASTGSQAATTSKVEGLQLDTKKNYGDTYANGLLPVGDNRYVTDAAKKGYVYVCRANFVPAGQAGAQKRGPWFVSNNTQWDINQKSAIQGSINWTPNITMTVKDGSRAIITNDLPNHHTGVFPVGATDPARVYDANPNTIAAQSLTYNLNSSPAYGAPQCMGGEVGVMLTGVALFNAFDAGRRDAGAWEVQDSCDGHPQNKGEYHYHTLSRCIKDQSVQTVIGFALDGFPITGPKVGEKNILTTVDLDECHGLTSEVVLDGKKITTYHYVMTQDFPYSVSCFRSQAIQPPGQHETAGPARRP